MQTQGLQRTLLLGLGHTGAQTADQLLAALQTQLGENRLVAGIAMLPDDVELVHIDTILPVPGSTTAESWQTEIRPPLEQALRNISQLDHLAHLRQQGIGLRHAAEIHALIIANPADDWLAGVLPPLIGLLRQTAHQILACHASLTGIWLCIPPEAGDPAKILPTDGWLLTNNLPLSEFDRGCFVAGLTNEMGLIVGDTARLRQRTVTFLTLLIREIATLSWLDDSPAGWGMPLTSFGLASVDWPGREVAQALSHRWTQTLLAELITLPPGGDNLADKAQTAARQWSSTRQLVPSQLLEHLTSLMPSLPNHLATLVPEVPWPWLLADVTTRLEQAGRQWQDTWLARQGVMQDTLAELATTWPDQAEGWLREQVNSSRSKGGAVIVTQSHLAALSELLHAFVGDLENQLEEIQQDLANMEERVRAVAGPLADMLKTMPGSVLGAVLAWGFHPFKWPAYWARCHEAQTMARNLAHLVRGRLLVWQTLSFYEEILPLYRQLLQDWNQVVQTWTGHCRQVSQAAQAPELAEWPGQLEEILARSTGPWDEGLVAVIYDEVVERYTRFVGEQVGSFNDWQIEQLTAKDIVQRLQIAAHQALVEEMTIPADHLLCRQLPTPEAQLEWLGGLLEQARPFWRFDETMLAEQTRAQVRQEVWLLLPEVTTSPLAGVDHIGSHPVQLISTHNPEQVGLVSLRRWLHVVAPDDETTEMETEL